MVDVEAIQQPRSVLWARLQLGLIVLICAEVFSGSSMRPGNLLFGPWTWLVTYWLYFAHFFFFTTLAVRTGRTSFWALYLWGLLYGLYEGFITKVIWHGYGDEGFAAGAIGPYGYSEISMVTLFHPIASFMIPLALACIISPELRRRFPDLACFTRRTRRSWLLRFAVFYSLAGILSFNNPGLVLLIAEWAFILVLLGLISRFARPAWESREGLSMVCFEGKGFIGLCAYLGLIYVAYYFLLNYEHLPSPAIQLATFIWYGAALIGLRLHRARTLDTSAVLWDGERELARKWVLLTIGGSFVGSLLLLAIPAAVWAILLPFVTWGAVGFVLFAIALAKAVAEHRRRESEVSFSSGI